jgi:hypothetical protein
MHVLRQCAEIRVSRVNSRELAESERKTEENALSHNTHVFRAEAGFSRNSENRVIEITPFSEKFARSFGRPSVSVTLGHFTNALRETAHSGHWL